MIEYIKESQTENPLPETELVQCIWAALIASVDWSIARPDHLDAMVMKETKVRNSLAPTLTFSRTFPSSGSHKLRIYREFPPC